MSRFLEVQFKDGVWVKFDSFYTIDRAMKCISKQLAKKDHISEWRIINIDWTVSDNGRLIYTFNKKRHRIDLEQKYQDI